MPTASTRVYPREENKLRNGESFLSSRWFNATFTVGKSHPVAPWTVGVLHTEVDGEGWCMILVAVVCLLVKRHRRGFSRPEGKTVMIGCANLPNEHKNTKHLVLAVGSVRTGKYQVALPRAFASEEIFMQEPPPAYIPYRGRLPDHCKMMREISGEHRTH